MKTDKDLVEELVENVDQLFQLGEKCLQQYEENRALRALKHQAINYYKAAAKNQHRLAISRLNELGCAANPR